MEDVLPEPEPMETVATTSGGNGSTHDLNTREGTVEGGNAPPTKPNDAGSSQITYKKTKGRATMKGEKFEIKLIALLFLRLKNSQVVTEFHLASNVDGAGALDDVMVKFKTPANQTEWQCCFVQLKHKESETALFSVQSLNAPKGHFCLKKYFQSYIGIKNQIKKAEEPLFKGCNENCVFVLYTNSKMHPDLSRRPRTKNPSEIDNYLKSGLENEVIFNFSEDCDKDLFDSLTENNTTPREIREFFKAFRVFSGEPSETQLDTIIKGELSKATGVIKPDIDLLYPYYIDAIETWWDKSETTLNQNCDVVRNSLDLFKVNTLSSQDVEQCHPDIRFLEEHYFKKDCLDKDSLLHIVSPKLSTKLTGRKLIQSLQVVEDEYIFVSLQSLLINTDAVMSSWSSWKKHRLVILSESTDGHDDLCNTLSNKMQIHIPKSFERKIIVVSAQDDKFTLGLKECLASLKCNTIEDNFLLSQLEPECKEKIDKRSILFQGQSTPLQELLGGGPNLLRQVLNDEFIRNIFNDDDIYLGPPLEETVPYYIPRTLMRCDVLSKDVLKEKDNVFIVHDITMRDLQKLVPPAESVGQVGENNKCRFYVVDSGSAQDTSEVYERKENVHELKMCSDGFLRWIKTKGSIHLIKNYIDETNSISHNPKTVIDLESRIVLVEASPGMGKSTLVTHLAEETKRAHPLTWVIRLNLSKHTDLFKRLSCEDGTEFLETALGIGKQFPTERALFRHSMEEQGNVVVMLDAFDEVAPIWTDKCLALLSSLKNTKVAKILITTRHSVRDTLETHLSTLAFTLFPFDETNQKDFFTKFWENVGEKKQVSEDVQKQLIEKLTKHLKHSLIGKDNELLGIPLHAMMLAEIYEDSCEDLKTQIPDKLDLLILFEKVIKKKCLFQLQKKFDSIQSYDYEFEAFLKPVYKDHMYAALVLILDQVQLQRLHDVKNITKKNQEFATKIQDSSNKTGIVDKFVNNKARFVHRMFAEYFAALWFYKHFQHNRPFLSDFLFTTEFQVVRRFFDLMLAKRNELHTAVINNDIPKVQSLLPSGINSTDDGQRSALQLAAALGFDRSKIHPGTNHMNEHHMVNVLLKQEPDVNVRDVVLEWSAIEYAIHSESWDAVEFLLGLSTNVQDQVLFKTIIRDKGINVYFNEFNHHSSLANQAAAYGYVNILRSLLSPSESIMDLRDDGDAMLLYEACSWNQVAAAQALVASLGEDSDAVTKYINTQGKGGRSCLHWASVRGSAELVELLTCKGGDIWARDEDEDTPLIVACDKNNIAAAQALIASLGEDSDAVAKYINTRSSDGYSCLHWASDRGSAELVEVLISKGGDIWARDENEDTPLIVACNQNNVAAAQALIASLSGDSDNVAKYINTRDYRGRSCLHWASVEGTAEWVELLISKGGDIWARDNDVDTSLIIACIYNNVAAAQALIASLGEDSDAVAKYINTRGYRGRSCLHGASFEGSAEWVELLISKGGDIWARDEDEDTPLIVACDRNIVAAAQALIASLGEDSDAVAKYINTRGKRGRSCLHGASVEGSAEWVELLIAKGGDIWARNKDEDTLLIVACDENNVAAAQALIASLGEDSDAVTKYINTRGKRGNSCLHGASIEGSAEWVELLIAKGGDIWARNKDEDTPLINAGKHNNVAAAQALIATLGGDSDAVAKYINTRGCGGCSCLHSCASVEGSAELVELLIAKGGDIWARNKDAHTPFIVACDNNNVAAAHSLIASLGEDADSDAVAKYINRRGKRGNSGLHGASVEGSAEWVELLISKGGDIWASDENDDTPLIVACDSKNVSAAQALITSLGEDADAVAKYINRRGKRGNSCLHGASAKGSAEWVELLISKGGDIWARNDDEDTPLIYAGKHNNVAAAHALIASLGEDSDAVVKYINTRGKRGRSCLHGASVEGSAEWIELLISKGGDIWASNKDKDTPLIVACNKNNVAAAQALIASLGEDSDAVVKYINIRGKRGHSCLHGASAKGSAEWVKLLISKGGDIWARSNSEDTPLIIACYYNNVAATQALIASLGEDSDAVVKYINTRGKRGRSCLHGASAKGSAEWVKLLISKGGDIWARNMDEDTPLIYAGKHNNVAAAHALIASLGEDSDAVVKYINTRGKLGRSCLHGASVKGSAEWVELLISKGGDIWARNNSEDTPLIVACDSNNVAAAQALIASLGEDSDAVVKYINTRSNHGHSCLHGASVEGSAEWVELLISKGGDIWARDKEADTPLIVACDSNNVAAAHALIACLGEDSDAVAKYINTRSKCGHSCLYGASFEGSAEWVEFLISKGGDIWARNKDEDTPLINSGKLNNVAAAHALISSLGEDSDAVAKYINTRGKGGRSILHWASVRGSAEWVELLISKGGDIWARDEDEDIPLINACKHNNVAAAQALIASLGEDADAVAKYINTRGKRGRSCLHGASVEGSAEWVELLIFKGGDIWARNEYKNTPLFIACINNNVAAAQALIASLGEDSNAVAKYINTRGKGGRSCLHFASIRGSAEWVELLISKGGDIWARNEDEDTPLIVACDKNNVGAAQALIASLGRDSDNVAKYINISGSGGKSAGHWVSKQRILDLTNCKGGDSMHTLSKT